MKSIEDVTRAHSIMVALTKKNTVFMPILTRMDAELAEAEKARRATPVKVRRSRVRAKAA